MGMLVILEGEKQKQQPMHAKAVYWQPATRSPDDDHGGARLSREARIREQAAQRRRLTEARITCQRATVKLIIVARLITLPYHC